MILPAPNVGEKSGASVSATVRRAFPAIILSEPSTRPSAERKRWRSTSLVVQRVTGASGGEDLLSRCAAECGAIRILSRICVPPIDDSVPTPNPLSFPWRCPAPSNLLHSRHARRVRSSGWRSTWRCSSVCSLGSSRVCVWLNVHGSCGDFPVPDAAGFRHTPLRARWTGPVSQPKSNSIARSTSAALAQLSPSSSINASHSCVRRHGTIWLHALRPQLFVAPFGTVSCVLRSRSSLP